MVPLHTVMVSSETLSFGFAGSSWPCMEPEKKHRKKSEKRIPDTQPEVRQKIRDV